MKKSMIVSRKLYLLPGIAAVALLAGCASGNYQKGAAAGAGLQASADKIDKGSGLIDAAIASLNDLVNNPGELPAQFKKFGAAVGDLESTAKDVSSKVTAMSQEGNAYFTAWDQQLAQIQNEDIKSRSANRKADVQKKFAAIKKSYEEASGEFKPFMSDLKDIQTALATDLTPGGLDAIKSSASRATRRAGTVKTTLGKLAGQFRDLGVAMSASVPQPAATN